MTVFLCSYDNPQAIHSASIVPDFVKLNNLISDHHLTESLELLDQCGFVGVERLAVLAFMQGGT